MILGFFLVNFALNCCCTFNLLSPLWCQMFVHIMSTIFLIYNHLHINGYMMSTNYNTWSTHVHVLKKCLLIFELIKSLESPKLQLQYRHYSRLNNIYNRKNCNLTITYILFIYIKSWCWRHVTFVLILKHEMMDLHESQTTNSIHYKHMSPR